VQSRYAPPLNIKAWAKNNHHVDCPKNDATFHAELSSPVTLARAALLVYRKSSVLVMLATRPRAIETPT
jgi:hypothetical protein